jgi:hypothetical protein
MVVVSDTEFAKYLFEPMKKKFNDFIEKGNEDFALESLLEDYLYNAEKKARQEFFEKLKYCENCGKPFVSNYKTEIYCDNEIPGKPGKTCKDIGYSNKVANDKVLSALNTAYKTLHAQKQHAVRRSAIKEVANEYMTKKLNEWRIMADAELEKVKAGIISEIEFLAWLKKNNKLNSEE